MGYERMKKLVLVVQELSLARDLETVMRIVRTNARELTGADGATFVLRDNGQCYYADEDAISPLWKGSRFPMSACVSGWAMINKQSAIIPDIYKDERIPIEAYKPTFVKSMTMVPIRTIDPIGAIGNYWSYKHEPSTEEIELLQSLADITAVTMENVQVYAELEQRVQERTHELEQANQQLEAFSYSVSHDLKSPLNAVYSLVCLLREFYSNQFDNDGKEMLETIVKSTQSMSTLIDELLTFFMMDKKPLNKERVDMKDIVLEISKNLKALEPNRNIEFKISELPEIYADSTLIKQVWTNLISNAMKYSQKKEQTIIEVGFEMNADSVTYYVKDNGCGFNMKYYDKLFSTFQRLHSKTDYEGTGIGLSIVDRIIRKHGGEVWAEGEVEKGATFYFSMSTNHVEPEL